MLGSKDIFLDRAKRELSVMQMNHCGIQECEKGHMWQFQARPYHLLHFVLQGEGSLKISGRMLNVHAGQAFFIPAGIEGKYIASLQNPWKYAWIGFYADNGNKFIDLLFGKTRSWIWRFRLKNWKKKSCRFCQLWIKDFRMWPFIRKKIFRESSFSPYGIFPHPWRQTAECCIFLPGSLKHRAI